MKAVVLLSSGIDCVTSLFKVKDNYESISALMFTYGAKEEKVSIDCVKQICASENISLNIIDLPWLKAFSEKIGTAMVADKDIVTLKENELDNVDHCKNTAQAVWIPARNICFISIAASFAETLGHDVDIITGYDYEEAITFPDNSKEFVDGLNKILPLGCGGKNIKVVSPLIDLNKDEICALALKLGAPIKWSNSCYNPRGLDNQGRPIHCGCCESCQRRKRGFKKAGYDDPTIYV